MKTSGLTVLKSTNFFLFYYVNLYISLHTGLDTSVFVSFSNFYIVLRVAQSTV